MNKRYLFWLPVLGALLIVLGTYIGRYESLTTAAGTQNTEYSKLKNLLNIIEHQYVDSVDVEKLIESAMPTILNELEPHSVYIPAKDLESTNAEVESSFSGVDRKSVV